MSKRPSMSSDAAARLHRLSLDIGRTVLEIPRPFESVSFSVLGMTPGAWTPGWPQRSAKRVVVSPFVDNGALTALLDNTERLRGSEANPEQAEYGPLALISRPEQLAHIDPDILDRFGQVYTLKEYVETEDGEEARRCLGSRHRPSRQGIFVLERVALSVRGSPNATSRAIRRGENIEVLAELEGRASQWKPEAFLGDEHGIGELFEPYVQPAETPEEDTEEAAVRHALEQCASRLAAVPIHAQCRKSDGYVLSLHAANTVTLEGVDGLLCLAGHTGIGPCSRRHTTRGGLTAQYWVSVKVQCDRINVL